MAMIDTGTYCPGARPKQMEMTMTNGEKTLSRALAVACLASAFAMSLMIEG